MLLRKLEAAEAAVRGMQGTLLSMADGAKAAAVAAGGGVPVIPGGAAGLIAHKAACKARVQAELGLEVDPGAVLISFVGRWAFEKGIDLIAEAVLAVLEAYSNVQFYVVGPIGDEAGQYAATRLCALSRVEPLNKRLFVRAEFFRVTEEMRFAADFTICPSRTEPFGYVDVEFAWHGCPTRCARGA